MKEKYRRNLPHIQPVGACFFVTFRLHGSLPVRVLERLRSENEENLRELSGMSDKKDRNHKIFNLRKEQFIKIDDLLESCSSGPHYLKEEAIRNIISDQLMRFDNDLYKLIAYSIMSNHVHILIDTSIQLEKTSDCVFTERYVQLDQIMKRIKGSTAIYCNREIGLSGQFWARESYDMYMRNEKMLNNVVLYILNNPVKAGLVEHWKDYSGNYLKSM